METTLTSFLVNNLHRIAQSRCKSCTSSAPPGMLLIYISCRVEVIRHLPFANATPVSLISSCKLLFTTSYYLIVNCGLGIKFACDKKKDWMLHHDWNNCFRLITFLWTHIYIHKVVGFYFSHPNLDIPISIINHTKEKKFPNLPLILIVLSWWWKRHPFTRIWSLINIIICQRNEKRHIEEGHEFDKSMDLCKFGVPLCDCES